MLPTSCQGGVGEGTLLLSRIITHSQVAASCGVEGTVCTSLGPRPSSALSFSCFFLQVQGGSGTETMCAHDSVAIYVSNCVTTQIC